MSSDHKVLEKELTDFVGGMNSQQAVLELEKAGWVVRISKLNGTPLILTRDYHTDRVNLDLEDDKVVKVRIG